MTHDPLAENQQKFRKIAIILAVAGLCFAIYATVHHIAVKQQGATDFACNINATFNCDDIARSPYAEFAGFPLGVWGSGYFLALFVLLILGLIKEENNKESLIAYVALVAIGVIASVGLGIISWFAIGSLCVTCIGVYGVCFLQAANCFIARNALPRPDNVKQLGNGTATAVLAIAVTLVAYNFIFRPGPHHNEPPASLEELIDEQSSTKPTRLLPTMQEIPINRSAYSGLGEDFRKGARDAKVTIVEFADFQCPACQSTANVIKQLMARFGDQILVVFKNYPLDPSCNPSVQRAIHPHACRAAIMARCAGRYSHAWFWRYHDKVFANQQDLSEENAAQWALEVGLSQDQIRECLDADEIVAKIKDDVRLGNQVGVDATPTIFINGRKYIGQRSLPQLSQEIERLLRE